ncbi:aspartyl-phosphate phosphatase Spo0E family protein [Sutcliffiella horikoshii]|uniref:Spo0E family sporulation regulatory protein-aspartic acid phosphatase n=1 Tax=Sutcliffiella horikoshii TaxID=79883 RepID=UPI002041CABE|nr:aspartyl-phosphate phosphatase Spo0E family protein [Sutcliffiella horikoshii]
MTVIERLLCIIEYRKEELSYLSLIKGTHDPSIIKLSQELDKLIYKYQKLNLFSNSQMSIHLTKK